MSNDVQSIMAALRLNDCISVTITTIVIYDYMITFPKEINYIWNQPWTWVSTLFIVVRYVGLLVAIIQALYGSSFIPGPTLLLMTLSARCTVLIIVDSWAFVPFLAAADLVMILRLHAMYRRSRIVLGVLLLFYVPTIILLAISAGFYNNPHTHLSVSTPRVFDTSYCSAVYDSLSGLNLHAFIARFILAALMFILALVRFFLESFRSYKATKQWLPNRYLNLLVRESVLYFLAHLLYNIDASVMTMISTNLVVQGVVLDLLSYALLFTLTPRFIMSVRELYVRDSRYGVWRRVPGVDTGFGFSEQSPCSITDAGSIRFADEGASTLPERASEVQVVIRTTEC